MNRHIKKIAEVLLPKRIFVTIQSIRSRNYQMQLHMEWGVYESTVEMVAQYGRTVLEGPFRGMKYPTNSLLSRQGIPILFAAYEFELHPIIEEVIAKHFARMIDTGCAEGYYAVGLARRTDAIIYAFDCESRERYYCRQMARENGVADRAYVRDWCSARTLKQVAAGRSLIIADCEGYEVELSCDDVVPLLKNCDLIIELHEFTELDVRDILLKRFKHSHDAKLINSDARNVGPRIPDKWRKFARETRSKDQQWGLLYAPHVLCCGAAVPELKMLRVIFP